MGVVLGASVLLGPPARADEGATITVDIDGAKVGDGRVVCRLFDEDTWLDEELERRDVPPEKPIVAFAPRAAGRYAVACFQDTDGNGKMTFGFLWSPKEASGFSNGYRPFGPPRFKKAAFEAVGVTRISLALVAP